MSRIFIFLTLIFFFISLKCFSQDQEKVKQLVEGIIAADNRADLQKVLSFYANDAILMPPDKPSIIGKDAIEQNYRNIFSSVAPELKTTVEYVDVCNNHATAVGTNTGSTTSKTDGTKKQVNSKYVMLLEKITNGEWKIKRLIWNNN